MALFVILGVAEAGEPRCKEREREKRGRRPPSRPRDEEKGRNGRPGGCAPPVGIITTVVESAHPGYVGVGLPFSVQKRDDVFAMDRPVR